ncbi:MAG: hypothetical protein ACRDGJ_07455, partial [Candidatus Limnocylindria bacterium]
FLGGPRPRPRRRPQPRVRGVRRAQGAGAGRRVARRFEVRGLLVGIAASAGLALFYLSQSGHVAATGYEIERLHATLAERRAEQQQLILRIGHARSPAEIARRAITRLHLVPLDPAVVTFARPSTEPTD